MPVFFYIDAFSSLDKPQSNDQRRQGSMGATGVGEMPAADDVSACAVSACLAGSGYDAISR